MMTLVAVQMTFQLLRQVFDQWYGVFRNKDHDWMVGITYKMPKDAGGGIADRWQINLALLVAA